MIETIEQSLENQERRRLGKPSHEERAKELIVSSCSSDKSLFEDPRFSELSDSQVSIDEQTEEDEDNLFVKEQATRLFNGENGRYKVTFRSDSQKLRLSYLPNARPRTTGQEAPIDSQA